MVTTFVRRPFFYLLASDAPLLLRYHRFNRHVRTAQKSQTLTIVVQIRTSIAGELRR